MLAVFISLESLSFTGRLHSRISNAVDRMFLVLGLKCWLGGCMTHFAYHVKKENTILACKFKCFSQLSMHAGHALSISPDINIWASMGCGPGTSRQEGLQNKRTEAHLN